ncbi:MAG: molybdopterin-dependent oxidoreductase, partial [Betaproteobacteria bacterium]|nr:molybdopterin-dependent oxidoreductase [Betaproteobacteria bacterium]
GTYEDWEEADLMVLVGVNTAWCHPVLFQRLKQAKAERGTFVVVIDPRRTATCEIGDLHLPLKPGSDVALFNGLLTFLEQNGAVDRAWIAAHTTGFEQTLAETGTASTEVAKLTGLTEADVLTFYRRFADTERTVTVFSQGVNQSSAGTDKVNAILNCHLATGRIGRPGMGPFSITGQPNAMGGREVGGLANQLAAHMRFENPDDVERVGRFWRSPGMAQAPGLKAVDLFDAVLDGTVKAVWIMATNPAASMPDAGRVRRALKACPFVVVSDCWDTDTTALADVVLPAATWGEKDGTVTNSERRISRVRAAVAPPGLARPDWEIVADLGRRLEAVLRPGRASMFAWHDARAVWQEHRETTRGRDLDITGLSWELLERDGPQQWPFAEGARQGRARLYTDGRFATEDGRARFATPHYQPVAEPRDLRFPVALTTGRLRDQWHGMSRSGHVAQLFAHRPGPSIDLHPADMARRGIGEGDLLQVTSRRGTQILPARADDGIAPGQAFAAMHWGPEFVTGSAGNGRPTLGVNAVTLDALDPVSRQPEFKHAAVKLLKTELPWRLAAFGWIDASRLDAARRELMQALQGLAYVSCVPFGRERCGLALHAAGAERASVVALRTVADVFGLDAPGVLRYRDGRSLDERAVRLEGDGLAAVLLTGSVAATAAQTWLYELLTSAGAARSLGRLLLAPGPQPPKGGRSRGAQVCNCFDVHETEIVSALERLPGDATQRLAGLQRTLHCGTQCGSCLPALRRLVSQEQMA